MEESHKLPVVLSIYPDAGALPPGPLCSHLLNILESCTLLHTFGLAPAFGGATLRPRTRSAKRGSVVRKIAVVLWGMAWAIGGCAAAPVSVPLPHGHPADPTSEESPFAPPANPFASAAQAEDPEWEPPAPPQGHGGHRP